jgi:hypothetical protein
MTTKKNKIPKEILKLLDLHDQLINNFVSARNNQLDGFEVHLECAFKLTQIIRHINAVSLLAKKNLLFFPSALVISRSAFELAVHTVWLLQSLDPWEREARWLRYAQYNSNSEFIYFKKSLEFSKKTDIEYSQCLNKYKSIDDFYKDVAASMEEKFPGKYNHTEPVPTMKKMLKEIGIENKYFLYINSSQYVHGSMVLTQIFRKGYGTAKEVGDFITPGDWVYCFQLTSMSLLNAGKVFLDRTGGNLNTFNADDLLIEFENAIKKLSTINGSDFS